MVAASIRPSRLFSPANVNTANIIWFRSPYKFHGFGLPSRSNEIASSNETGTSADRILIRSNKIKVTSFPCSLIIFRKILKSLLSTQQYTMEVISIVE